MQKYFIILFTALFLSPCAKLKSQPAEPPFMAYIDHPWVDSVLNTLNTEEKIAQSIWIAAYSNKDISHEEHIADMIKNRHIGGIVFFQGSVDKQVELINYYRRISKVPLIFSMDAEWGIGMRLPEIESFPFQMTLGAVGNDSLLYRMGSTVAEQCKRTGIQVNFAPVADINNNPANPVINYRSFGENRENVAKKTAMYMKGMQDNGILATAKHFPGHGDTDTDSHADLPVIRCSRERLDSLELFPFKYLIDNGIGSIMTSHISLPAIDGSGMPATISKTIIDSLLKKQLQFKGLTVSDAMNMKGITKYFSSGEAEARALYAGNDVVEFVTDIDATIRAVKKMLDERQIDMDDINRKCKKILALKYWTGLNEKHIYIKGITDAINSNETKALIHEMYANALTLLNNEGNIIPVRNGQRIAVITVNKNEESFFEQGIARYQQVDCFSINTADNTACTKLMDNLSGYDLVIAGVFGLNQRPYQNFGIKTDLDAFLKRLISNNKTIVCWFGNPYSAAKVDILRKANGLLLAYQDNHYAEDVAAQLIFGGIGAKGSLPVTINERWPYGFGIITPGNLRLQYGYPENAGLPSEILERRIDSIVNTGLSAKAFPGCEVMAAKNGIVIFDKCYGFHTYDNRIKVKATDMYDLASVTKVTSTIPALMLLESEGRFSPEKPAGEYIHSLKGSDKGHLIIKDILTHQAGLTPWIPFWQETLKKNGQFKNGFFNCFASEKYPQKIAAGLYTNGKSKKLIVKDIRKSPLGERKYLYSDLGFIMLPSIVEHITGEPWNKFVTDRIYSKIGADNIVFNPWKEYSPNEIVPTEYDSLFRKQQIHGTVHDEAAAMQGGISGHAGLFANANDIMKLLELYRNKGSYGGEQIIKPQIIDKYTAVQFPENDNRRGLGFDKPLLENDKMPAAEAYPCKSASPSSFGHSGFTGTFIWIDPEHGISYVFLSNRVYPSRENNKLSELNIRTEILQTIYDTELSAQNRKSQ